MQVDSTLQPDPTLQADPILQIDPTLHVYPTLQEGPTLVCLQGDRYHGMTPLHMLAMNPHASGDTFGALLEHSLDAVLCTDGEEKTPIQHARESNVSGLLRIIHELSMHRLSLA